MNASISITEFDIFTALRAFLLALFGDCEVIRTQDNRLSMPRGGFIALSPASSVRLATNFRDYDGTGEAQRLTLSNQVTIQVDCYGKLSAEWVVMLMTSFRSEYASEFFTNTGLDLQPLYTSDPMQMPLVNGEQQYESRWMIQVVMQTNAVVTLPQQFSNTLGPIGLISVDVAYPPQDES